LPSAGLFLRQLSSLGDKLTSVITFHVLPSVLPPDRFYNRESGAQAGWLCAGDARCARRVRCASSHPHSPAPVADSRPAGNATTLYGLLTGQPAFLEWWMKDDGSQFLFQVWPPTHACHLPGGAAAGAAAAAAAAASFSAAAAPAAASAVAAPCRHLVGKYG
jgi:hypothetical protein